MPWKEVDVPLARRLRAEGKSLVQIAALLGCCRNTIRHRLRQPPEPEQVEATPGVSAALRVAPGGPGAVPVVLRAVATTDCAVHVRCPHCRQLHAVPLPEREDVSGPFRCPDTPHAETLVAVRHRYPEP